MNSDVLFPSFTDRGRSGRNHLDRYKKNHSHDGRGKWGRVEGCQERSAGEGPGGGREPVAHRRDWNWRERL